MADIRKLAQELIALCRLDIDAVTAYEQAFAQVDHPVVRKRFTEFVSDHNRHIVDLSQQLRDYGEVPPRREPGKDAFFTRGFSGAGPGTGIKGVLEAMEANERIVSAAYADALDHPDMSPDARALILENYEDEKRHLEFVEESSEAKVWEKSGAVK